ncbi:hypothetical protein RV14_GL001060 [Enterococcus ratti]|uniref:Uncharacterized protein n=1 Tax=Enterococcus ratti TaxID=150033 RepID=A0A1L8WDV4_9ENTE|nr:hypothetical protein RV14_GL001060 [Enterococcus ratti]
MLSYISFFRVILPSFYQVIYPLEQVMNREISAPMFHSTS